MLLWPINKYPGTDYETFNWEWILHTVKTYTQKVDDFIEDITDTWNDFRDDITDTWHNFRDWVSLEINQMHDDFENYVNVTEGALNAGAIADGAITEPKINTTLLMEIENAYATPEMYGAVGDGVTDDTDAFNTMLQNNTLCYIPPKTYKITDTLYVQANTTIIGNGKQSILNFSDLSSGSAIETAEYTTIENLNIIFNPGYVNITNTIKGISAPGTTSDHMYNVIIRNCVITGFETGIYTTYVWNTLIEKCYINQCLYGIRNYGQSVNDKIDKTYISLTGRLNNSIGIYFEGGVATEGWTITNCFTYRTDTAIRLTDITHCIIEHCILDFNYLYGVEIVGSNYFSGNHTITSNYIAIDSTATTGIGIGSNGNTYSLQLRGNIISDNLILSYASAEENYAAWGIKFLNANDQKTTITNNHIYHFVEGISTACYNVIVTNNYCKDCSAYGVNSFVSGTVTNTNLMPIVANNQGTVYLSTNVRSVAINRNIIIRNAPFQGAHDGDIILAASPDVAGTIGWVCVNGTAGTFKPIVLGDSITA